MPGATETVTGWEEPAVSVKLLGEMVTPDGRLPAETEIGPVKPLLAVADTVTGKESPAAMLMSTGEAASWKPGAGGAAAAVTVTPTPKV